MCVASAWSADDTPEATHITRTRTDAKNC